MYTPRKLIMPCYNNKCSSPVSEKVLNAIMNPPPRSLHVIESTEIKIALLILNIHTQIFAYELQQLIANLSVKSRFTTFHREVP